MIKSTLIYISIYIGIYIIVLLIQAFITFLALCNGELYLCVYKHSTAITTIQTLSYVLAPLIVILGLNTWRKQHTITVNHDLLKVALQSLENMIMHYEYTYSVFISHRTALVEQYPQALKISDITPEFDDFKKILHVKRQDYLEDLTKFKLQHPIIKLFIQDNNLNEMAIKDKAYCEIEDSILQAIRKNDAVLYRQVSQNLTQKYNEVYSEYHKLRGIIINELYIE